MGSPGEPAARRLRRRGRSEDVAQQQLGHAGWLLASLDLDGGQDLDLKACGCAADLAEGRTDTDLRPDDGCSTVSQGLTPSSWP